MARGPVDALETAVRALARRELSAAEVAARLARAGVPREQAEEVVASLRASGLQSDARAAAERARVLAGRSLGDSAIAADLAARRLEPEAVEAALAELPPELGRAAAFVARSTRSGPAVAHALRRKGFSAETIESVLASVVANES